MKCSTCAIAAWFGFGGCGLLELVPVKLSAPASAFLGLKSKQSSKFTWPWLPLNKTFFNLSAAGYESTEK